MRAHHLLASIAALLVVSFTANTFAADPAPFDLAGPNLKVKVTRGGLTLPIAEVPNLAAGDRLSIQADLPANQSAHYLLVAAFLRGATNPPPENWFFPCETWTRKCSQGLSVTVPQDAQQMLLFLAPETGGDLRTLTSAVRGRPGAFVRTSQDLNQASLDRARLEKYLAAIRAHNESDPDALKSIAPLLARSLAIKVDEKCLDRSPAMQAPCLMQGQSSLILNDGHSTSIVEALTTGPASDLAMEASFTPQLSYGYYSPYIASVLDIARIFDSFRTAQYQYIPALTAQSGEQMALALNTPPSFHNPKSVLVVALPAVEKAQLPPLHAVDPKASFCARKDRLSLPVEGAPLVFSTSYVHDVTFEVPGKDGRSISIPATIDAEQGGFVVPTAALQSANMAERTEARVHGSWGFDRYDGPAFALVNAHAQTWQLAAADQNALIVGRDATVRLRAASVSCIDKVSLKVADGIELETQWRVSKPNEVEVTLPLQSMQAGSTSLLVRQYGVAQPQALALRLFNEAARLDRFAIHAGDQQGTLKGSRLDEVSRLSLQGVDFVPAKLATVQGTDELQMVLQEGQSAPTLKSGETAAAKVTLNDGRVIELQTLVESPRPRVTLISKSVQAGSGGAGSNIQLGNQDELPQDARLTFSLHAQTPPVFARDEKIEIATADESVTTMLSVANGGLTLGDSKVAVATLDPAKAFGSSAFGPLQFRTVANGVSGDWQPLATLVRLPVLKDLKCPATPDLACKLSGSSLFLVDSVASAPNFEHPVQVPDGFPGYALPVPHPNNGLLYIRLRDDPAVVSRASLDAQQLTTTPEEAARADVRHAAATPPAGSAVSQSPAPDVAPISPHGEE